MHGGRFSRRIASLPRGTKKLLFVCFDVLALVAMLWLSFSLRLNNVFVPNVEQALLMLAAPAIALPIFIRMGLYRSVLRFLPERAIWTILSAVTVAALAWVSLAFLTQMTGLEGVPRTVALFYWALSVVVIAGSRFGAKWLLWPSPAMPTTAPRTLIYGTGNPAMQLVNALTSTRERNVVGFVSDDANLEGMDMLGLRVYPMSGLEAVVTNFGIDEIILTTTTPNGAVRRELVARFGSLPVKFRILPAITDLAAGKYSISDVRDIDIDDLLRRSPVPSDPELMRGIIEGRVILITGAAGSIGSALSRTVAKLNPEKLVLMDFNEHGLYEIGRELAKNAKFPVVRVLGSVADAALARQVLCEHSVETIYHCAAFKHVSMVEANCVEGARNNVLGTWTIAEAAYECGVRNFILISSDKAVRPASAMGATKRWSELIVRYHGTRSGNSGSERNFASVRFGNVIGSSGSVVPLFKEQIAAGGPVTLTHPDMTRYFMSVREAAELIIQATALSTSGDVLLLEMGEPVAIKDLAEDMILLAGRSVRNAQNPDGDIEIVTIGAAEGEKLHEELFYDPSGVTPTSHPKILRGRRPNGLSIDVPARIASIRDRIEARDEPAVRQMLFDLP
ncbi:nucleoside-diphosphate sugar epimerase/dehydratase [Mesorhizobium sp. KR9-304]|uniref:nucleoside-diphosphate sugar epimerase/dehydratase n=1 Tax=Mesorhizobium sp. KR9-304 TaxID=3156614 RepID=UPI0032B5CAE4